MMFGMKKRPPVRPIAKIVAYYRIDDTEPDAADAYGIEQQRRDVARFAAERNAIIIREFSEIASGTRDWEQRAEFGTAIRIAHVQDATLVVGRQDRLACTVRIISEMMEWGSDFVSVDDPNRDNFQKHLRAARDEEAAGGPDERGATNVQS
jgi:DNA invertase Pin-like site-specific DNA recombinase